MGKNKTNCFNTYSFYFYFSSLSLFIKNNNKNEKTLRSRVWYGIKSGWDLAVLPDHIAKLDNTIPIRIFKTIGGICVFIIISGYGSQLSKMFMYTIFAISLLYIMYRFMISFYAIKHWIYNLRSGNFIVPRPAGMPGQKFSSRYRRKSFTR